MELTESICSDGGENGAGANGQKRRFMRQPIPKKVKRLRRNRRLRKILTPKNALMSLHELLGTGLSEFNILPEERGFVATVYVNNVQYEGRGKPFGQLQNFARNFLIFFSFHFERQASPRWQLRIMHRRRRCVTSLFNVCFNRQKLKH